MSDSSAFDGAVDNGVCYRHPGRQSFVLCQRCGRTICGECQTPAAVGFHCPECIREARQNAPRVKSRVRVAMSPSSGVPVVTYSIMALCVVLWLAQVFIGDVVTAYLLYYPPLTLSEPWRMLTVAFVHSTASPFHLLFNMYALWLFGRILEQLLGRWRFLALYLISGFGGSVAVLLLAPTSLVVGASGAVFGLFGAFFVIQRRLGSGSMQLIVVIGINLVIGFVIPGISWQGHVGGLIAGVLVGLVYMATRRAAQRNRQILGVVGVIVLLLALTVVGWMLLAARFGL
ncbi:MAG: rhomboid family intramembrane serine protease [Cryobacterium sp.]|nr:rhomboid family intramembrane serine protease [Cryobacterium sp.]